MPYRVTLPPYRARWRIPRAPLQFAPTGTHNVMTVRFETPSDTWVVTHNKGVRPVVQVFTDDWQLVAASVVHESENVVRVQHNTPITGWVILVW